MTREERTRLRICVAALQVRMLCRSIVWKMVRFSWLKLSLKAVLSFGVAKATFHHTTHFDLGDGYRSSTSRMRYISTVTVALFEATVMKMIDLEWRSTALA